MFFEVYGANALAQWGMLLVVLVGLILFNEFARRTKLGGAITFFAIPLALTIYFIAIAVGARMGAEWALTNQTHLYMNGWFHYAKLYAALTGCIGFMMIKYEWGIGAKRWFKPFPFIIVAINILIAVASDFESAIMGWNKWWLSSEGVWLYGGWHNVFNGLAGLFNIAYTYNCLPTHSWYCGIALLLAPTVAALLWNRGGWIQNRANTLAIWCMFAQVFPLFQEVFKDGFHKFSWVVLPTQYVNGFDTITALYAEAGGEAAATGTTIEAVGATAANPTAMLVISALALITNIVAFGYIMYQAKVRRINPYKEDVFVNQKYYKDAMARAVVNS